MVRRLHRLNTDTFTLFGSPAKIIILQTIKWHNPRTKGTGNNAKARIYEIWKADGVSVADLEDQRK